MSATRVLVRKEFRALGGLWFAGVAAMIAAQLSLRGPGDFGVLFYVGGALALGAASMGHEYRFGTLAQLLTQPMPRVKTLAIKFGVLAALLLALAGLAAIIVFSGFRREGADRDALTALLVLPPLYGLLVAPWLTLKTRSTLAGMLFSGSLAGLLFVSGDRIAAARFESPQAIDAFTLTVMWTGSWILFAWAAFALWRAFATLEVLDGARSDMALPTAFRVAGDTAPLRRHPFLRLAQKELRLQQLTFVGSIPYVVFYVAVLARGSSLGHFEDAIVAGTAIHGMVVVALVGALSCAEERALGTLDWQLLLPISARAQFVVKVAVATALALLLAIGLPAILTYTLAGPAAWPIGRLGQVAFPLLLLLAGSMYLSTVSSSAIIAFFACVPAFMMSNWFLQNVAGRIGVLTFAAFHRVPAGRFERALHPVGDGVTVIVWGIFALLILVFAFKNHRESDRSLSRAAAQLLGLAALATATCAAFAVAGTLF
jgi:hypothetical protein